MSMQTPFVTTRSELHKVVFLARWLFCLCMKYLRNRWTDLRQIHTEDVFGLLGRVLMSRSKVKVTMDKKNILGPYSGQRVVYVW